MEQKQTENYISILKKELVPALGCTEPIAIAYAAAKARQVLNGFPSRVELQCSGNIIKNVKSVTVPNSGGLRGVDVAAVLGVVGGNADRGLEVLKEVTPEHIEQTKSLLSGNYFSCTLKENVENLYIDVKVFSQKHSASVTVVDRHTNIVRIIKDGGILRRSDEKEAEGSPTEYSQLSVRGILDFADTVPLDDVRAVLEQQMKLNSEVADEGMAHPYGAEVGRSLLERDGADVWIRAKARAAAGSDARMGGCSLPVVINSGSGNQGMTVSLPVMEYAKEWGVPAETLYRALLISNLVAIHQKHYIGSLSAFCGAVSAACGAGAAITYMAGGGYEDISRTIINTLGTTSGIVCDGAKSSCAAKIAAALDAALLAHHMAMKERCFRAGEGIVMEDVEKTMRSIGHVGKAGMKGTDIEILKIMIGQIDF